MSEFRHAATLNSVGVIVLIVGLGWAGFVYQRGQKPSGSPTTPGDWKDSTLSLTDSKSATRNIELYGGKVEVLMVRWLDWLHHPETQAILIALISALLALGCFLFARHWSAEPRSPHP